MSLSLAVGTFILITLLPFLVFLLLVGLSTFGLCKIVKI